MDHYAILGLKSPLCGPPTSTLEDVKQAYRRALLSHHPDKSAKQTPVIRPIQGADTITMRHVAKEQGSFSIDEIKTAFSTLSDPKLRAEYDRELIFNSRTALTQNSHSTIRLTGGEIVDLDDMLEDESTGQWYRSCRCGNARGYVVDEEQLENAAAKGEHEVIVGCHGCSLWIRIAFGIDEGGG